jgi:hypothetical protein
MFKLYKQTGNNWNEIGQLDFDNGRSTVQQSLMTGETCIAINNAHCLTGNTEDLKQLLNHINVILGDTFEKQIGHLSETFGYGLVMQEVSQQWNKKASSEGRIGEGFVVGPHNRFSELCGCEPGINCDWCCGSGWLTKHVKSLKGA